MIPPEPPEPGPGAGTERAAVAYTIFGCCSVAGVNLVEYLADVLPRLARRVRIVDVPNMLPRSEEAARGYAARKLPVLAAIITPARSQELRGCCLADEHPRSAQGAERAQRS